MAATFDPSSYFSMPGSFHSEGVHPGLIRTPGSPGASTHTNIFSTSNTSPNTPSTISRQPQLYKRRRDVGAVETPSAATGSSYMFTSRDATQHDELAGGRSYLLGGNLDTPGSRPHGAGYFPSGTPAEQGGLGESMFSDTDYRTVLGTKRRREETGPQQDLEPTSIYPPPALPSRSGWGSYAFNTIGGVVGKVWDFCWGTAFKGFHAGSGTAYDMPPGGQPQEVDYSVTEASRTSDGWDAYQQGATSFPQGNVVHDDRCEPPEPGSGASTPPRPAAKRRQTDRADELGKNWVVIPQEPAASPAVSTPATRIPSYTFGGSGPRNRNAGPSVTTGRRISTPVARKSSIPTATPVSGRRLSRPTSRAGSHLDSGDKIQSSASRASFASPRASHATSYEANSYDGDKHSRRRSMAAGGLTSKGSPHQRHGSMIETSGLPRAPARQRTYSNASAASGRVFETAANGEPLRASGRLSPQKQHRRDSLATSGRRGSLIPTPQGANKGQPGSLGGSSKKEQLQKLSPRLPEEAMKLAAKRRMEERDADVRMSALNKQLQDMIRQGREALGTTVDVEMDGDEKGGGFWEDDE